MKKYNKAKLNTKVIKRAMKEKGFSEDKFVELANLHSKQQLKYILEYSHSCSLTNACKFARALDLTLNDIIVC